MALEALRQQIGEQAFLATLREWTAAHAYGNVTIAEFIALAESTVRTGARRALRRLALPAGQALAGRAVAAVASLAGCGGYLEILRSPAGRLIVVSGVARLSWGVEGLALLFHVQDAAGSYAAAGLAVGALGVTSAAFAPLRGALIDRRGRTRAADAGADRGRAAGRDRAHPGGGPAGAELRRRSPGSSASSRLPSRPGPAPASDAT